MTMQPTEVVAQVELRLVVPGSASVRVPARLCYDVADPYAVRVAFQAAPDRVVEWTFARQLLTDGVSAPAGEGDVRVWPAHLAATQTVCLSLTSPSGQALFEASLATIVEFLTASYVAVPTGCESDYIDLDHELALLLSADPLD